MTDHRRTDAPRREILPFTVTVAAPHEMEQVCALRVRCYGKHFPALSDALAHPEEADGSPGNDVIVAKSKLDGSVLGSFRTNSNAFESLPVEHSLELPPHIAHSRAVEATRFCVTPIGSGTLVTIALFKALYLYAQWQNMDWIIAGGRKPIDRTYERLHFQDIYERGAFYPMKNALGVPHRMMAMETRMARIIWETKGHPLFEYAFQTQHPDIDLSAAKSLASGWKNGPQSPLFHTDVGPAPTYGTAQGKAYTPLR